jgi:hypothetical protein
MISKSSGSLWTGMGTGADLKEVGRLGVGEGALASPRRVGVTKTTMDLWVFVCVR